MRRDLIRVLMLILAALMAPGVASAEPTVKVKAEAVPIPGFPQTGDILGAGTAAHGEITIEGNEYFGSPPPLIGVNVHLPCPRGGWPAREEVIFADGGEPSQAETVDVSEKLPCPNEAAAAHRSQGARR
jgi:hypothetical protein